MHRSFHIEPIPYRCCRRCNWRGPVYLESCQKCAATMGEACIDQVVVAGPEFEEPKAPETVFPAAVLAIELSASEWRLHALARNNPIELLEQTFGALPPQPVLLSLPSGVVCVLYKEALHQAVEKAAESAIQIRNSVGETPWEVRMGLAHGLIGGRHAGMASVTRVAAGLARAGQAGQTLTTMAIAKELEREWSFAPVGVLPRRLKDKIEQAMLLDGRKAPVRTPSALARDDGADIIGREGEMRFLSEQLREVTRLGEARWCGVVAPAGGGKSKLLRHWLAKLDDSVKVAGASASPLGGRPLSVLSELCSQLGCPLKIDVSPVEACRYLRAGLRNASSQKPVVLIVDDLHWCDEASLQALKLFSNQDPFAACFVILSLRQSFLDMVPWLSERSRLIKLPELDVNEREIVASQLFRESQALAKRIAHAPPAGNPLYIEQCVALLRETGDDRHLPESLHEVILQRLQLLLRSLNRPGYERTRAEQLQSIEDKICEWLDRLETGDYEGRSAIAEYLGLLESIDASLVILKSIVGKPQLRNRRLVSAIERFYSASFPERSQAIENLARRDRIHAAYAAEAGAQQALESLRIKDAIGYLELAVRYADDQQRLNYMIRLGDCYFWARCRKAARQIYESVLNGAKGDFRLRALGEWRLGRVALVLGSWQEAKTFLEKARPNLEPEERFLAGCERVYALAVLKEANAAKQEIERLQAEVTDNVSGRTEWMLHWLQKTKLQLSLLREDSARLGELAAACANTFVFESYTPSELAEFVTTLKLLTRAKSVLVSETLMAEGRRFEMMFENAGRNITRRKPAAA